MSTVQASFNISTTIVKSIFKVAGLGFVADAIEGGQELYNLACNLKDETFGSPQAHMSRALTNSIGTQLSTIENQLVTTGYDDQRVDSIISVLETSAKQAIKTLLNDEKALSEAITKPEAFHSYVLAQSAPARKRVSPDAKPYLDTVLHCVADEYLVLAPKSPNFEPTALWSTVRTLDEVCAELREVRRTVEATAEYHSKEHQDIKNEIESLRETVESGRSYNHRQRLDNEVWGSRPRPLIHWIERHPTSNGTTLQDAIFSSPSSQHGSRCVLIGHAGSGKTRLAASIADRCEDEEWTLVAWIDAASDEKVKNQVIAISEEKFGIQPDPGRDDTTRLNRALAAFPSQRDQKILLILDNADNYEHLDKLLPKSPNIRVIATTRHGKTWSGKKGWSPFKLNTFSREESITLLTQATQDDDTFTANLIAERLDDLPLAIGRAANTCSWLKISKLKQYYSMLQKYPTEKLLDSTVATMDNQGVVSALQIAGSTTLDHIGDADVRNQAKNVLYTLCYLSEYGVPAQWFTDEHDLDSMCAYATLMDSSLIEETADGATTTIHRLQAYAMRLCWHPTEQRSITETISTILTRQLNFLSPAENTANGLILTRSLIEQFRAMSDQSYSHFLFGATLFQNFLAQTLAYAHHFELAEAISLGHTVLLIARQVSSSSYSFKEEDAGKDRGHSLIDELIMRFDQLVTTVSKVWGRTYSDVLMARETLAQCYMTAGLRHEAILCYESLVIDCEAALSKEHPLTHAVRESLEAARRELAQQEDDPHTEERGAQD